MQAVRTVPDSVLSSVDGMVDGLSRVLQVRTATTAKDSITREGPETLKVGASLDTEVCGDIIKFPLTPTTSFRITSIFKL